MTRVTFIFATGASWMDSLVTAVTKSQWSHVALRFDNDDVLLEALAGHGLILQSGGKYDGWKPSLTCAKLVSEQTYDEMIYRSRQWAAANIQYGYRTCVAIGMKELFGQRAGHLALGWLTGSGVETLVCSEVLVNLWRVAVPEFMMGWESRLVSPDELYQALTAENLNSQN